MTNENIIKHLAIHGMEYEQKDGKIIWIQHGTQNGEKITIPVDITGISKKEIYSELGY